MLNSIALVGRLTKEVELNTSASGNQVTKFAIAFNQGKNADGSEDTGFIDCATFGKQAEACAQWLSKGDKVAVTGKLHFRKYDKKDGSKGVSYQILVDNIEFIDILKTAEDGEEEEQELPFEPAEEVKVPPKEAKPVAKATRSRR